MEAKGLINKYVCENCKKFIFTINLNTGVTPFGILCKFCGQNKCFSGFYKISGEITVTHAWYRPISSAFHRLPTETQIHICKGGLILGDLGIDHIRDIISPKIEYEKWLVHVHSYYRPCDITWKQVLK